MNLSFLREDEVHLFGINKAQPDQDSEPIFQTFNVKCQKKLSPYAKSVLLSWKGKPFYCANEDILYLFKFNRTEQDFLQRILHSTAIFLQNSTCTSLFDISIYNVTITEAPKFNRVHNRRSKNLALVESITFKLKCHITHPPEKSEIPW